MVTVERLDGSDVLLIRPRKFADRRGYFLETWRADTYGDLGIGARFVQDNEAFSAEAGTIRGLHFQAPPAAQAKLIRVIRGAIFDVAVDLRRSSPRLGRWCGGVLTAEGAEQMFVPRGFAHGYCTLEPNTQIAYKCDAYYDPALEGGIHYADPEIGVEWPTEALSFVVSDRDASLPKLSEVVTPFDFEVVP
jgi:dTDP-4-dehydrorhamnose 3,5-epimerase